MAFRPSKCLLPQLLQERHIEPVEFYLDMGWSKQQYHSYVKMKRVMSASTLKTVAEYLGVPMDDVYKWQEVGKGNKQSR